MEEGVAPRLPPPPCPLLVILAKYGLDGRKDSAWVVSSNFIDHGPDDESLEDPRLEKLWHKVPSASAATLGPASCSGAAGLTPQALSLQPRGPVVSCLPHLECVCYCEQELARVFARSALWHVRAWSRALPSVLVNLWSETRLRVSRALFPWCLDCRPVNKAGDGATGPFLPSEHPRVTGSQPSEESANCRVVVVQCFFENNLHVNV